MRVASLSAGYAVLEVDPATLSQTAAHVTAPYPRDAAYSPDGSTRTRRQALLPGPGAGEVLPFTTVFSADGTHVHALVKDAAASTSKHFTARSRTSLTLTGAYRKSRGVNYFHSYRDVPASGPLKGSKATSGRFVMA